MIGMTRLDKDRILQIVKSPGDTTHHTHNFHPYSAKFIPQLPHLLIQSYSRPDETVLDPFCGSGTTLVEAKLLGRRSIGVDIHPLGAFMSRVKVTKIDQTDLAKVPAIVDLIQTRIRRHVVKRGEDDNFAYLMPTFRNRDHWFQSHVMHELSIIKTSVDQADVSRELRDFMLLALSSIIVTVSNQESETRYAFAQKAIPPHRTFQIFRIKVSDMIDRMLVFNREASDCESASYCADVRELGFINSDGVDLIVTSPPYPNTYDYYLYHKLRMIWLGMEWRTLKRDEIGSRLKHSSWRMGIDTYMRDMVASFGHLNRVLKKDGLIAVVMGDSVIRGEIIKGDDLIANLAVTTGFKVLDNIDYDLGLASRTFNRAFRNANKREHILLLVNEK